MKKINLNAVVKVKLTDVGRDIFYHQFDFANTRAGKRVIDPMCLDEDEDGRTEFQLWELIELYGPHIGMGKQMPFEPIYLYFEDRDVEEV